MTSKIIVSIPGLIWENNPYSLQGFYLCKIFYEHKFEILCVSYGTVSKDEYVITDFKDVYINNDCSKISDHKIKENLNIYKSIKYYTLEGYESNGDVVYSSKYNKIINKFNADYLIILGDLYRYIVDEPFNCKTISWYPNHFEPLDNHTAYVLKHFDKVLCLYPSAVDIVKKSVNDVEISYLPHVVDYQNIDKPTLSKDDLRKKYDLPLNSKIITVIAGNYEKFLRKGFDVILQVFKKALETRDDIYLFMQCYTINLMDQGYINDIDMYINYFNIPKDKYHLNKNKVSDEIIEEIYALTDVLLVASKSEGFCLPIIEAQLRGIPVVSNRFTAMRDYTFYGKTCDYEQLCYESSANGVMSIPSVKNLTSGLLEVLDKLNTTEMNLQKEMALEKIKNEMSYDNVKKKLHQELLTIKDKPKLDIKDIKDIFYCFYVKNVTDVFHNEVKNLSRHNHIVNNINDLHKVDYKYLVILHKESKLNKYFFDSINDETCDILLKTKLENNRIYPMTVKCVAKNNTMNNLMLSKENFKRYVKKMNLNNFDNVYKILLMKSFANNNMKITDNFVIEYKS